MYEKQNKHYAFNVFPKTMIFLNPESDKNM